MTNPFFEQPVLNSPYECPSRHWELDEAGQPTQKIIESRRQAEFIMAVPKAKKRKGSSADQAPLVFDEGKGLSTQKQQYEHTAIINEVRRQVDRWRSIPDPSQWQVTPETAANIMHRESRIPLKPVILARDKSGRDKRKVPLDYIQSALDGYKKIGWLKNALRAEDVVDYSMQKGYAYKP